MDEVIDNDERKHYLKPEQEVRNYFLALNYLEEKAAKKEQFSQKQEYFSTVKLQNKGNADIHPPAKFKDETLTSKPYRIILRLNRLVGAGMRFI